ncbi:MAG: hypothetical protein IIA07_04980 [Proteobacteria bacterium]|nr:hypothetical protein [Pseudomonadota bacterium]
MSSFKFLVLILVAGNVLAESDGFLIGGGIESDSEDGIRGSLIGGVGISERTWLSGGLSMSSFELPTGQDIDTFYADVELDHWFDPVGVRVGVAYWGDSDILDSFDWRGSLYWRGGKITLSGEYEFREFDFTIPESDVFPGREIMFDADGFGAMVKFQLSENASLRVAGMKYDYSVDFQPTENRDVISLISVSRLGLINSLIDDKASLVFAIDRGVKRWEIDVTTWRGVVDQSRTKSLTVRYLMPTSGKTDIEFGLGYDDSELYGDVTFFSVFLYFYGGG